MTSEYFDKIAKKYGLKNKPKPKFWYQLTALMLVSTGILTFMASWNLRILPFQICCGVLTITYFLTAMSESLELK